MTSTSSFRFVVDSNTVYVNQHRLGKGGPPSDFHSMFGLPNRIADGSPTQAPVEHRNNQLHYYDQFGITLNEHHFTHQIHAMNLVFDTGMADNPTHIPFSGELLIAGVSLVSGSPERLLADSSIAFTLRLPGTWFAIAGNSGDNPVRIAVTTKGPILKSGRCSKSKIVTRVSFCLTHDPWDTAHKPQQLLHSVPGNRSPRAPYRVSQDAYKSFTAKS